ncbi:hypothetical protein Poli38472_012809 [Pythium oligandrum]|uniref:Calcineurin-like phosphoesterase domain-containing protein n=1 Tax=Pythium oligandrum TaxID=41045 RepID=A0A8K1FLU4_PYTOL|nr:hypothetical protein Poli38472_012809 [Pythium oligandrum]|eukprot:TMW64187.1 hypothetical protein Poli38472_012809 [Pythium oligandrum]
MEKTGEDNDQLVWFALYGVLYVSFYFFTSPFVGNPELLTTWTPYVYISMGLYGWLFAAAALHTPLHQLGLLESTIKQPITLLFPFFSVSFAILVILELLMVQLIPRVTSCLGVARRPENVSFLRSFANVLRNSAAISVACVALIIHCDPTDETEEESQSYNHHACDRLFLYSRANVQFVPESYRGALVIWIVGVALAMTNFVLEQMSGIKVINIHWIFDRGEVDAEESEGEEHLHETLPHEHRLPMVPWYSMFLFDTAFQLLISLKVFLGRFDHRSLQRALYPDDDAFYFDHLASKNELWLDFMADCGDGFNSSYQIARLLAQPELEVECPEELLNPAQSSSKNSKRKSKKQTVKKVFPRGDTLLIGGDLAYPHPDSESYEQRLWRCFEYAMKPPRDYDPEAISTNKPYLPEGCEKLSDYKGPTVFAIPGNHDWFDGLNTFTRFIAHRDWLGGWLLPQKTSHFCLKLPHNWWVLGVDLALENDINTEQFSIFERLAEKHMGDNDTVIIVTHEPRWILDPYEQSEKTEEKLTYLINNVLKGRVVLRLAGDIHNYTRHSLKHVDMVSEVAPVLPGTPPRARSPQRTRSSSLMRRRHSMPAVPLQQRTLSPTRKHFPHMYEEDNESEGQVEEVLTRRGSGVWNTSLDAPPVGGAHHLIVAGGGGAFLHPTHAPQIKNVQYRGSTYKQRKCYPPEHVSRRYTLLNVMGFRRINWRFDIVGGLGYFLLVFSMFPRCSVHAIHTSATWQEAAMQFAWELLEVQHEMLTSSYVSFVTYVMMLATVTAFADFTSLWKKCITGLLVSFSHCLAAFSILLIFECIFEVAIERGSLGHEGDNSLYRYFTASLPDFSDVQVYDVLNVTQLFAEFMKFCMTIFDVPEMVAVNRIKICSSEAGLAGLSRTEMWRYYFSVLPYFWVLATPVVGVIFGAYLYIALNVFGRHYNEAFSALRIASYKNMLRMHVHPNGDLEVFAFGVDKMPRKWRRDPHWSGGSHVKTENKLPSYEWKRPSYWLPVVSRVSNMLRMDFENRELDGRLNMSDRSTVHLIDRVLIRRPAVVPATQQ